MKAWVAISALLCAVPVAAQDPQKATTDFTELSDEDLRGRLREMQMSRTGDQCVYAAIVAELTNRGPGTVQAVNESRLAQAWCHVTREEFASAVPLLDEIDADAPGNRLEPLGVYIASMANDGEKTLKWLKRAVERGSLHGLVEEQTSGIMSSFRLLWQDGFRQEHDALCADIAQADWFDETEFELQQWCASAALKHDLEQGDLSQIGSLLGYIRNPEAHLVMLASRQYEAAWPQIEAHVGPHLERVTDSFVSWAAQRLADNPYDRDRLSVYAYALLYAGYDEEAVNLARDWLSDASRDRVLEEGDGWALEVQARALDSLGRVAEADLVFDRLAGSRPDQPWIVNFLINRAVRLASQNRWQEALDAYDVARPAADQHGTDYAKMLIATGRTCALHKLGRSSEAESELDFLVDHPEGLEPFAASGLLCAGQREQAEALIADAFERQDDLLSFVQSMQDDRFDMTAFPKVGDDSEPSDWLDVRDVILGREDLKAKVLEHVRLLPDHLVPIGYLRRQERLRN